MRARQSKHHSKHRPEHHPGQIAIVVLLLILGLPVIWSAIAAHEPAKPVSLPIYSVLSLKTWADGAVPPEIVYGDRTKKDMIFTFDAGDTAQSAQGILAVLAKHHVKGTFFMTGKFVEANPALVRQIAAAGNEIFDHTYDHKDLTTLTRIQIRNELDGLNTVLASTTGMNARPFFRAPYGARDPDVLATAAADGFQSVYWTVDARDWMESQGETADQVKERILTNIAPGTIVLMHVGDSITASVLDEVFAKIESQGYKIVSLTQGLDH